MSRSKPDSAPVTAVAEPAELLSLVARITASRHFSRSQRLRSFLEFVCQQTLAGNAESICEQALGHHVFGRAADYDPGSDNIVRVEARELRKRLGAYFASEGVAEPIVIRVPKGGYVPSFNLASESNPESTLAPPLSVFAHPAVIFGFASLLLLSVALTVALIRTRSQQTAVRAGQKAFPPLFAAFWSKVFDSERGTLLSLADSNLSLLQDLRKESISLTEYASGRYLASVKERPVTDEVNRIQFEIASRYYTSLGDAKALARLAALNRDQAPVTIRFARDLKIGDLKSRNAALLGSARSNPWVELLSQKRRFHIEYDEQHNRPFLRDSAPENGKPSIYLSDLPGDKPYAAYGIVASVPNLDATGIVLLVAGTNGSGTEAAGEFLTSAEQFSDFLKEIKWNPDGPLPVFEVVLKLVTMEGSPILTEILAYDVPETNRAARFE